MGHYFLDRGNTFFLKTSLQVGVWIKNKNNDEKTTLVLNKSSFFRDTLQIRKWQCCAQENEVIKLAQTLPTLCMTILSEKFEITHQKIVR